MGETMSETDSFIEEVTEEVQREKLFGYIKRYGWIVAVFILLLVGGTAFNEYRKSQAAKSAQDRGDRLMTALEIEDEAERNAALESLGSSSDAGIVEVLLAANEPSQKTSESLRDLASDSDVPQRFRDLAQLKLVALSPEMDLNERLTLLEPLAAPGATFQSVALEYLIAAYLEFGETDKAIELLTAQVENEFTSPAQAQRMTEILVALGVEPDLATGQSDDNQ